MGTLKERQVMSFGAVTAVLCAVFSFWTFSSLSWIGLIGFGILSMICFLLTVISGDIWSLRPADSHTFFTLVTQYIYVRLVSLLLPIYTWKIRKENQDPRKANERTLLQILRRSQDSEYGRKYRFSEMKSQEDFITMHPVTEQEHYRPYMERMARGEENVIFTGETKALISTSGTTGQPKIYAFSKDYVRKLQQWAGIGATAMWKYVDLQRGFGFHIHSPIKTTEGGVTIGAGSQVLSRHAPFFTTPKVYSELRAEDASFYAQALFALVDREMGWIQGFSADLMYSLWKFIGQKWENICNDVAKGYIGDHIDMPEDVRAQLSACLKADPKRATELRDAMKNGGNVGLVKRVWPNFRLLTIGKSAAFKMCADFLMENQFKGVDVLSAFHGATESMTGMNLDASNGAVGEVHTLITFLSFTELIPLEEVDKDNPRTVFPENAQVGELYEIVHTNLNGLYRCRYGDVIKVVGFNYKMPKYEFQYKLGQRLNIAYERTPDSFLYQAIVECDAFLPKDVRMVNYTTTESIMIEKLTGQGGKGHYVYFMEFDTDKIVNTTDMAKEMDNALYRLYQPYRRFKDIDSIGALRIVQVKTGTFEHLKNLIWSNPHAQFKMPRVQRREGPLKYLLQQQLA